MSPIHSANAHPYVSSNPGAVSVDDDVQCDDFAVRQPATNRLDIVLREIYPKCFVELVPAQL